MAVAPAFALAFLVAASLGRQLPSPEAWARADANTRRLAPSELSDLSQPLRADLERRGCTIPQAYTGRRPHNVVQGSFRAGGKADVAVLCSRKRTSTIVVFWGGDTANASEIAARPDADFLQVVASGQIGFCRVIATASPEHIREQYRRYGGALPSSLPHDGISDMFIEKASVVWYWHDGRWLQLAGAN